MITSATVSVVTIELTGMFMVVGGSGWVSVVWIDMIEYCLSYYRIAKFRLWL